ncbi:MAG TPA: heparinase II/III family protein [Armatimonadota bacterium]|jgi:hypothetical protein
MYSLIEIADGIRQGGVLFPQGHDAQQWARVRSEPQYDVMRAEVVAAGEELLATPLRAIPFSLFRLYHDTGARTTYEMAYFEHRRRLTAFTALCLLYPEDARYRAALEDVIWAVCDEFTWALPAHMPEGGLALEPAYPQREWVDLFAAETGFALAEACSLLDGVLAPHVLQRARSEVRSRVLEPFLRHPAQWWQTSTNNWAAVCAGAVGAAGLYLYRDEADPVTRLTPFLGRVLGCLESFLTGFDDDGACTEGLLYWDYGFGFFTYFAALLHEATGGTLDLFALPKVEAIAHFQEKAFLSGNAIVSFSDSTRNARYNPGLAHYLARRFPGMAVPDAAFRARFDDDHCYRFPAALRRFAWLEPRPVADGLTDGAFLLPDAQWWVVRTHADGHEIGVAAKGGRNDESHNHNDIGNVILAVDGEQLLADLGSGEYTATYFGPERYRYLCNDSRGHSVPRVDGMGQRDGGAFHGTLLSHASTPAEDTVSLEIGTAYEVPNLRSLVRTVVLDKTAGVTLRIHDRYRFAAMPTAVSERFIALQAPAVVAPGVLRITGEHAALDVRYDAATLTATVTQEGYSNHSARQESVWFIDLAPITLTPELEIAVEFHVV